MSSRSTRQTNEQTGVLLHRQYNVVLYVMKEEKKKKDEDENYKSKEVSQSRRQVSLRGPRKVNNPTKRNIKGEFFNIIHTIRTYNSNSSPVAAPPAS